jgi:hypothetical protein
MSSPWQNAWVSDRQQDVNAIEDQGIPKSIAKTVLPPTKKQVDKQEKKDKKKRHLTPNL